MPAYGSGAIPTVWQPQDLHELRELKSRLQGRYCFAAGGTLLRTQWEGGLVASPEHLICLSRLPGVSDIYMEEHQLVIGALTRLNRCEADTMVAQFPLLQDAIRVIAAPSIRNVATLGGNIVSGVGDTIPALLVYDAQLNWMTDQGMKRGSLASWLNGGEDGRRNPEDVLVSIHIPMQEKDSMSVGMDHHSLINKEISYYRKLGRRETFSASLVTIAMHGEIGLDGRWKQIAIAAGGGSGMAMRLPLSEQLLRDEVASVGQAAALASTVITEFITYGDAFASEQYRKQTAGNLLGAGLWEALN
ncbi:FAD binding domain-containing protein [Paenibacillus xylanexedens]|uniref:FAD binding domain-containing protein n=1 Tax=Paenibacillus xylanexedens TaxID=528191 RepID=UPI001C92EF19|nr:FAD binding domain-containing protein [Paenibacillus xylanexedens]